jgi:hypothetical protein
LVVSKNNGFGKDCFCDIHRPAPTGYSSRMFFSRVVSCSCMINKIEQEQMTRHWGVSLSTHSTKCYDTNVLAETKSVGIEIDSPFAGTGPSPPHPHYLAQ